MFYFSARYEQETFSGIIDKFDVLFIIVGVPVSLAEPPQQQDQDGGQPEHHCAWNGHTRSIIFVCVLNLLTI